MNIDGFTIFVLIMTVIAILKIIVVLRAFKDKS